MAGSGRVGNLTVGLGLDYAAYSSGLTKAEALAQASARRTRDVFKGSLAADLIGDFVKQAGQALIQLPGKALEAVDAFNDLKDATGASIEGISAIDRVARETGTSFETVETAILKLNQALNSAQPDSPQAKAISAIGLSVQQLKQLDPSEALRRVAVALTGFADDGNKARLVQELFGKSLKEIAPLLVDLGQKGELVATTTTEQAQAVEDYRKKSFALRADIEDLVRTLTIGLIPKLIETTNEIKELFGGAATSSKINRDIEAFSLQVDNDRKRLAQGDSLIDIALYGTKEKRAANLAESQKKLADARAKYQDIVGTSKAGGGRGVGYGDFRDSLPDVTGKKGPKDDPSKRTLENYLKAQQDAIQQEQTLLQNRNKFLDLYYGQNLISVKDYYDSQRNIQALALADEVKHYDNEIAALRAYQNTAGRTQVDRAFAEGKIEEATRKRAEAVEKAGVAGIEISIRQAEAERELKKAFDGVRGSVLELNEEYGKAAAIRFDQQNDALRKTFTAEGNQAGLEALNTLRAAAIAQGDFQRASTLTGRTFDELSRKEEYLALAQQSGAATSFETLQKVGELRRSQIPLLEAQLQAEEAIAKASGSPRLIANAEQSRLALERLKATADPLAESIRNTFESAFENSFTDFITGSKSAADAFKSFANSVINDLARIAAKELAQKIFGGISSGGSGGGLGSFLGSIFGPKQGTGPNSGVDYQNGSDLGFSVATPSTVGPSFASSASIQAASKSKVTINNYSGAEITESTDSNGDTVLAVQKIVRATNANDLASGRGLAKGISSTFGVKRQNPRRQ